jgi:hypothetical protein
VDRFFHIDGLRVSLQSDFLQNAKQSVSQGMNHASEKFRQKETWRTAADVNRVHGIVGDPFFLERLPIKALSPMHAGRAQKLPMIADFLAYGLGIRSKTV